MPGGLEESPMPALLNDPDDFCRKNQKRQGSTPVAGFERLGALSASQTGELHWTVEGKTGSTGHPRLDLTVSGQVSLTCQRCMEAFPFELTSRAFIILVRTEADADIIEASLAADDPVEVIAFDESVDLMVLIEDEALLALPLSPRHEVCPGATPLEFGAKRESPFAVLKDLKLEKEK